MYVVSFARNLPDVDYATPLRELEMTCSKNGWRCHLEYRQAGQRWLEAVREKPAFIRACLKLYKEPVLWVDADAKIESLDIQALEKIETPIGAFPNHNTPSLRIMLGVVYYNLFAIPLLDQVLSLLERTPELGDHTATARVLQLGDVTFLTNQVTHTDVISKSKSKTQYFKDEYRKVKNGC